MLWNRKNIEDAVNIWINEYCKKPVCLADVLCDRHSVIPEKVCVFFESVTGNSLKMTFAELSHYSAKAASFLKSLGVKKKDRVVVMIPKSLELIITALAVWRLGAVFVPLYVGFGVEAISYRLKSSLASVMVVDAANRKKVTKKADEDGFQIVNLAGVRGQGLEKGDYSFWHEVEKAEPLEKSEILNGQDPMVIIYSSGTTGQPKGCVMPVKSLSAIKAYMHFGLDLREEDVFWNISDPGWAYGLYYNVIGSLLMGKALIFYDGPFEPETFYKVIKKYRVTNLTGSPTAFRKIAAAGRNIVPKDIKLRVVSSAGEPLNPELISWAKEAWGVPIYDHYGQTEGGMMVNNHNFPGMEEILKPGSMGKPMPGYRVILIDDKGNELGPGLVGEIAVDTLHSPLFCFNGYWNNEKATEEAYTPDRRYYLTSDLGRMDKEGNIYYIGRKDDIIISSGYRIGPFEVESALMKHEAVEDAVVVGKPDEIRGEIIKAYVVLKPKYSKSDNLAREIKNFVKKHLSAHAYPREIQFVDIIPRTYSGKAQRMLLKNTNQSTI